MFCDDPVSRAAVLKIADETIASMQKAGKRNADLREILEVLAATMIKHEVQNLPSAVIYCRDCKWFGEPGCAIRIVDDSDKPGEIDFCSFAERKTDD